LRRISAEFHWPNNKVWCLKELELWLIAGALMNFENSGYLRLAMIHCGWLRNPPVDTVASHLFVGFQASFWWFLGFLFTHRILAQSNDFMIGVPDGAPDVFINTSMFMDQHT
jgi:hypothetical protein